MKKILFLTNDVSADASLAAILEQEGFKPVLTANAKSALDYIHVFNPAALIIDFPFAVPPSTELFLYFRDHRVRQPIVVLASSDNELDTVLALEAGADDYMVKPYAPRELIARLRALIRRHEGSQNPVRFGSVEVDLDRRTVSRLGKTIDVTPSEYRLLSFFVNHPGIALTRENILRSVWGRCDHYQSRTLDTHVRNLRRKLEEDSTYPRHFLTLHRIGYRFLI